MNTATTPPRARYLVTYKDGKVKKQAEYIGTTVNTMPLNEEAAVLEIYDGAQVVLSIDFNLVYRCERVEILRPSSVTEVADNKITAMRPNKSKL